METIFSTLLLLPPWSEHSPQHHDLKYPQAMFMRNEELRRRSGIEGAAKAARRQK
jgi:hypothetical protein